MQSGHIFEENEAFNWSKKCRFISGQKKITKINGIIHFALKACSVCFSFSHLVMVRFKALAIRLISYVLSCLNFLFFTRSDRHPKISSNQNTRITTASVRSKQAPATYYDSLKTNCIADHSVCH